MTESDQHVDCSPASSLTAGRTPAGCWPYRAGPAARSTCAPSTSAQTSESDFYPRVVGRNSGDWSARAEGCRFPSGPRRSRIMMLVLYSSNTILRYGITRTAIYSGGPLESGDNLQILLQNFHQTRHSNHIIRQVKGKKYILRGIRVFYITDTLYLFKTSSTDLRS